MSSIPLSPATREADEEMIHPRFDEQGPRERHQLLLGCVGPRPIALVSTLSKDGTGNLSPFSFFNAFSSNPPVVAFSPARRGRDGTFKDTYNNLMATKECVVHAVTYAMVEQINLASTEYPPDVDEFIKSGLTPIDSHCVRPKRVRESPFHMECRLKEMVELGDKPGAGNLAICEVIQFHAAKSLVVDGIVHPDRIDLVGRHGADFYSRAHGAAIFQVPTPTTMKSMGYDQLPEAMRSSHIYSANNLGRFAIAPALPTQEEVDAWRTQFTPRAGDEAEFSKLALSGNYREMMCVALGAAEKKSAKAHELIERTAKCAIEHSDSDFAWKAALFSTEL